MLIRRPVLDAIAAGSVTALFRRWDRPRVRPGGTQRTVVGVLEFTAVEPVAMSRLTAADARAGGFPTVAALRAAQPPGDGRLFRIAVRLAGPDPRVALRERADLTDDERGELAERLARLDRRGPWTAEVLALIAANEGVRAPDLAERLGRETRPFKLDVRKLKELGLTESLEVGYRLSPRGRAYLLLDDERYQRIAALAEERGTSVAAVVREAIDRGLPHPSARRAAAADRILAAEPMPVPDGDGLPAELDEIRGRRA